MTTTCKTLFVGAGAMGGAILRSALRSGLLAVDAVHVVEHREETCAQLTAELGVQATVTMPDLRQVGRVVLAVKPQVVPSVLPALRGLPEMADVVSIAAGITLANLREALPHVQWFRAMPNTAIAVGAGMTALTSGTHVPVPEWIETLFRGMGQALVVSEADLDRLGAVCGSGPGYLYVLMDAMADAGVRIGLPRKIAMEAAAYTFLGAGTLAVETGLAPALLRDQVTSPGGTTIAGIAALEREGGRTAMHDAVLAAYARTQELADER